MISLETLLWNIPEQKQGTITVVGGNSNSFRAVEQIANSLSNFPFQNINIVLPESLKTKIPPIEGITFVPATASGSFANSATFQSACAISDTPVILAGDFSKNSETAAAIAELIAHIDTPIYFARDTLDLVCTDAANWIERPNINIIASMAQLQKLFRSLYYPKMILLTAPLPQIEDALHKFTISYPCTIVTFHNENIIVAKGGEVELIPISKTDYTPLSLWQGQLVCNIAALNFYNQNHAFDATVNAVSMKKDRCSRPFRG